MYHINGSHLFRVAAACLLIAGLSSCSPTAAKDRRDERNPVLKRANAKKAEHDIEGAIELYSKALDENAKIARAHLELGLIYDSYREDYVRAIYHYERYLELRPEAEKKDLIEDLVRHARISFAASLPDRPSGAIEEIALLKREIRSLKGELEQATRPLASPQRPLAEEPSSTAAAPAPAPAQPSLQTYRVRTGDTLSRIASKVYGDSSKWKPIFEANRDTMETPQSLKPGQTLKIPRDP